MSTFNPWTQSSQTHDYFNVVPSLNNNIVRGSVVRWYLHVLASQMAKVWIPHLLNSFVWHILFESYSTRYSIPRGCAGWILLEVWRASWALHGGLLGAVGGAYNYIESIQLVILSCYSCCLVKAGAKTNFHPDFKSPLIKSRCTYQIFSFEVLYFKLVLRLFWIFQSCFIGIIWCSWVGLTN